MKSSAIFKNDKIMWIIFIGTGILVFFIAFLNQPSFGKLPQGERRARVLNSPNYRDGKFQNLSETPQLTSDKNFFQQIVGFLFRKVDRLEPANPIPAIKTDLHTLNRNEDILIWLGHGSYFIQIDRKRILVDPVLKIASPVSFYNKPFRGSDQYKPEDIPEIDYLVISHDHWDHLDYKTVKTIRDRTGHVICPLGVGEHFEYWGYDKEKIIEPDWYEKVTPDNGFTFHALPARHFSGRRFKPNQSLWASFMLQTPTRNIFIGGDGGYDTHFKEINKQFGTIHLAILENGQYDADWKYIHLLPDDLVQAINDLNPEKVLTVHNSKYALAKHAWDEPLKKIAEAAERYSFHLLTPQIGEVVQIKENGQSFNRWWENIE